MSWKLFRKKKDTMSTAEQLTDKAAGKIVAIIVFMQNRFAMCLNRKTKNFSIKTWRLLIVFLAIAWGSMSIYFIATAFTKPATTKINSGSIIMVKAKKTDSLQLAEEIYKLHK